MSTSTSMTPKKLTVSVRAGEICASASPLRDAVSVMLRARTLTVKNHHGRPNLIEQVVQHVAPASLPVRPARPEIGGTALVPRTRYQAPANAKPVLSTASHTGGGWRPIRRRATVDPTDA